MEVPHDDSKIGLRNKRGDWVPNAKAPITPLYWFPFQPLKFLKHIFFMEWICVKFLSFVVGRIGRLLLVFPNSFNGNIKDFSVRLDSFLIC